MELKEHYNTSDIETMKLADAARVPGRNRVEEIASYARKAGFKRIGIANCVALQKETEVLKNYLSHDFEVFSVNCKYGQLPASELLGGEAKGISCNPAGQADFLAENNTELNVVLGLCMGHDMVFTSKSKAPSTTLIVKDREFKHNPMEAFKQNT